MTAQGYATPEEAARGDIPERYARTLALSLSPSGHEAVVLLLTNEGRAVEPYQMVCERRAGRWFGGAGANGYGWTSVTSADTGVLTLWEEVAEGVVEVVVRWRDEESRVQVTDGFFLYARWETAHEDDLDWPEAVRYLRADSSEEEVERDPRVAEARERMRALRRRLLAGGLGEGIQQIEFRPDDDSGPSG